MQALADTAFGYQTIIRNGRPNGFICLTGMNRQIHPGFNLHGLVVSDEASLEKIISLTLRIKKWA